MFLNSIKVNSIKSPAFWREFSRDGQSQVLWLHEVCQSLADSFATVLTRNFFLILLKSAVRLTKALKLDMFNFGSAHPLDVVISKFYSLVKTEHLEEVFTSSKLLMNQEAYSKRIAPCSTLKHLFLSLNLILVEKSQCWGAPLFYNIFMWFLLARSRTLLLYSGDDDGWAILLRNLI